MGRQTHGSIYEMAPPAKAVIISPSCTSSCPSRMRNLFLVCTFCLAVLRYIVLSRSCLQEVWGQAVWMQKAWR